MSREQNLWKWLKKGGRHFEKTGRLHMCRIENLVGSGYPDVEGCLDTCQFHIELKAVARPKRESTPIRVNFQPRQIPWLRKRWDAGGNCWVLLRVGERQNAKHYLIPGDKAHKIVKIEESELEGLSTVPPEESANFILREVAGIIHIL